MKNTYCFHNAQYSRPLNMAEQTFLFSQIQNGDINAKNAVISSCLPLVINIATKFSFNNKHIDIEDMIQEGNIALITAVENWDINKGSITTVATWCIRNRLIDMINDSRYTIKYPYSLSRRAAEELRKINNINSNDVDYISKETGLAKKRIKKLLCLSSRNIKRVGLTSKDSIKKAMNITTEESNITTKPCLGDLIDLINNNLSGDKKTIFCLWSGINTKKIGKKQIAVSLGKTEKYVYDNIKKAIKILSHAAKKVNSNA